MQRYRTRIFDRI